MAKMIHAAKNASRTTPAAAAPIAHEKRSIDRGRPCHADTIPSHWREKGGVDVTLRPADQSYNRAASDRGDRGVRARRPL